MKEFKYVVTDAQGIHARPAGILVKAIAKKTSDIKIKKAGDTREAVSYTHLDVYKRQEFRCIYFRNCKRCVDEH